ncbi:uncharacterized protein psq [Epargyreus clarus]|uniref:uncharacterized protein psq n=1 Tax=Epargyreus clarus TaxID=520877 RepID=UPI003C2B8A21
MPGNEPMLVKCEPPSDDEDSQYHPAFLSDQQITSELLPIKLERVCPDDENVSTSTDLLHHLQQCVAPAAPAATPVRARAPPPAAALGTLETLEPASHAGGLGSTLIDRHATMLTVNELPDSSDFIPLLAVKDEPLSEGEQQHLSGDDTSDSGGAASETPTRGSPKTWSQRDMDNALDALRNHHMSLTKASARYGIPSTTLWQRAHRLGIDTPKKDAAAKSWSDADLRGALHALRAGAISANKASKAYGIPSSTLYKIARREGIRLAAPFNAAPTAWRRADLERALAAIRCGAASVQRAAAQYGIPTGTLYGRCKREGIELSRSNPTPWSEDAMGEALEAVRVGQMSINQAAIHYNLPYSSLYGRFKRCKYQIQVPPHPPQDVANTAEMEPHVQPPDYQQQTQQPSEDHSSYFDIPFSHMFQEYEQAMYYSQCNGITTS